MSGAIWPMPPMSNLIYDDRLYDDIFTVKFFADLCRFMNITQTVETLSILRGGHFQAFNAYFMEKIAFENQKSLKEENTRLDQVARDAGQLRNSLTELYDYGETLSKLAIEIKRNHTAYTSPNGHTLADLIDSRLSHPLFAIMAFLSDLTSSAERAQSRDYPSEEERYQKWMAILVSGDMEAISQYVINDRLPPTINTKGLKREYRLKGAAIEVFITHFAAVWTSLGAGLFNSGHTVEGLEGTKSRAADAVLLTMRQLDRGYTRAAVTTALRKWEAAQKKTS
jgi:hypothetical protein